MKITSESGTPDLAPPVEGVMSSPCDDRFDPEFVEQLFDEMAPSYEGVNYVTSFGFSKRWRSQCASLVDVAEGETVADLMCGMGECWPPLIRRSGGSCEILAVDFSAGMLEHAEKRRNRYRSVGISLLKQNVLANQIPDASVDHVVSGFGLKTLSSEQQERLAVEIHRILKPGGGFSLIEVSVPGPWLLRVLYMGYLKNLIPWLGKCFLGSPRSYRMLGVYTEEFGNCRRFHELMKRRGFDTHYHEFFWGCATGVSGTKQPMSD